MERLPQAQPDRSDWYDRDRFILSNGHASMLLYSLLHLSGYDLPLEELKTSASCTPKRRATRRSAIRRVLKPLPARWAGLANAVGPAIAERTLAAQFNQPDHEIVDHYTYVFMGDGCLMEGSPTRSARWRAPGWAS